MPSSSPIVDPDSGPEVESSRHVVRDFIAELERIGEEAEAAGRLPHDGSPIDRGGPEGPAPSALDADHPTSDDTVMAFSQPDEAAIMEIGFRGDFQSDLHYFAAIDDPRQQARIDELARQAHPLVQHIPFAILRNAIAWSWVKLRQDISDLVTRRGMHKLSPAFEVTPAFLACHDVLGWTYNGSLVVLTPNPPGIDVHYEAIVLRRRFILGRPDDHLAPACTFRRTQLTHPFRIGHSIATRAIVCSRLRAAYWIRVEDPDDSAAFRTDFAALVSSFRSRISEIVGPEGEREGSSDRGSIAPAD